jgi:hypothetical protein
MQPGRSGIVLLFSAAATSTAAWAAPTISSVSGVVEADARVTISGSGFGSKATAGPLVFDNFESGQNGQGISGNAPTVQEHLHGLDLGALWQRRQCPPLQQPDRPAAFHAKLPALLRRLQL